MGYAHSDKQQRCKSIATEHKKTNNSTSSEDKGVLGMVQDAFRVFARRTSEVLGTAWSFVVALLIIAVWAATGHIFNYSDTWQLIINTGTTIVTFLMVFLIQNTQNRDSKAVGLKLDELIRAVGGARNNLVDLERMSDQELAGLKKEFERIGKKANANEAHVAEVKEELQSR